MEVEVDAKALFGWLLVALIILGLVFAASHGGASLVEKKVSILLHGEKASPQAATSTNKGRSPGSSAVAQTTPQATTDKTEETTGEVVSFEDLSSKWDWTVSPDCASRILDFLSRDKWVQGHKIDKLVLGLVDEKAPEKLRPGPKGKEYDLLRGAALPEHPPDGEYKYGAMADCIVDDNSFSAKCYVAPALWSTDTGKLSVVVLVSLISALENRTRPKTMDAWTEFSRNWHFVNYVPLIQSEGGEWRTNCLKVRPHG